MANSKFNARHGLSVGTPPVDVISSSGAVSAAAIPGLDASKITSGLIDSARLPSYVDDVLEYADLAALPATGETGKIYVALDTNKTYRWSGSTYVEISASLGDITGPGSAVDSSIAVFDGVTGKLLKDGNKALPAGSLVGTTDTQSLSNKTLTGTQETVFAIADTAAFEINPANGGIQVLTLGASRTPKGTNFLAGQSVMLMIDDGTAYTINWTDTTFGTTGVTWVGGTAPVLATTGYTIIELWKVGTKVYGAYVGAVA